MKNFKKAREETERKYNRKTLYPNEHSRRKREKEGQMSKIKK